MSCLFTKSTFQSLFIVWLLCINVSDLSCIYHDAKWQHIDSTNGNFVSCGQRLFFFWCVVSSPFFPSGIRSQSKESIAVDGPIIKRRDKPSVKMKQSILSSRLSMISQIIRFSINTRVSMVLKTNHAWYLADISI